MFVMSVFFIKQIIIIIIYKDNFETKVNVEDQIYACNPKGKKKVIENWNIYFLITIVRFAYRIVCLFF